MNKNQRTKWKHKLIWFAGERLASMDQGGRTEALHLQHHSPHTSELVAEEQIEEQKGGVKDGNPGVYHPWITR